MLLCLFFGGGDLPWRSTSRNSWWLSCYSPGATKYVRKGKIITTVKVCVYRPGSQYYMYSAELSNSKSSVVRSSSTSSPLLLVACYYAHHPTPRFSVGLGPTGISFYSATEENNICGSLLVAFDSSHSGPSPIFIYFPLSVWKMGKFANSQHLSGLLRRRSFKWWRLTFA